MTGIELSVVIPTHERPESLARCLRALAKQELDRDAFEVLVVDDGSERPPEDVIFELSHSIDVRLLRQDRRGPAAARSLGAREARGTMVVFTDDDCEAAPDWLSSIASRVGDFPGSAIGGRTINKLEDNPYSTASQLLIDFLYEYYNPDFERASFFTSSNLAFPKESFLEIGGFDPRFLRAAGEDREIWDRWREHELGMVFAPEARVYHSHQLALSSFWRQHFGYGRGAWQFHKTRAERGGGRIEIEPLAFYVGLLRYPTKSTRGLPAMHLTCLMLLTQIANAAGYYWQRVFHP